MLKLKFSDHKIECGTDEAGRGCLAGPVTAAAVILKKNFLNNDINDSKKISKKNRYKLKDIIEKEALEFSFTHIFPKKIDEINILNASILAMQKSIGKLFTKIDLIIVDGNKFKNYKNIPHQTIIKGDEKFLSIAAASIIAKTERDNYMNKIHKEYPQYGWDKNKGYPTKFHKEAILKYGITKYHRKSFKLFDEQFKLKL
ncbi:ribonuclease HII [Flavobacteriaceae bacterium]|jgi:ribonuclease HII|nr:ribonuclease HII [Flavobacteriaceae bacterium]MDC1371357.1 ribonuclease HII [Flavobacteriaceae bacterium]